MKEEQSKMRGRVVQVAIVLAWLVLAIVLGFIVNTPTSREGLIAILSFPTFLLCLVVYFFYNRRKKHV